MDSEESDMTERFSLTHSLGKKLDHTPQLPLQHSGAQDGILSFRNVGERAVLPPSTVGSLLMVKATLENIQ